MVLGSELYRCNGGMCAMLGKLKCAVDVGFSKKLKTILKFLEMNSHNPDLSSAIVHCVLKEPNEF